MSKVNKRKTKAMADLNELTDGNADAMVNAMADPSSPDQPAKRACRNKKATPKTDERSKRHRKADAADESEANSDDNEVEILGESKGADAGESQVTDSRDAHADDDADEALPFVAKKAKTSMGGVGSGGVGASRRLSDDVYSKKDGKKKVNESRRQRASNRSRS